MSTTRERSRYEKRVGTVVDGRWRIEGLLGWGATSAVYEATHRNGSRAALKVLHQALCSDRLVGERFLQEAGIANAIKHRAIVPIRDDGMTEDGCAYLVLELLEGETLDARRERSGGRLSLEELAPIAESLMSAIAAVHAAGIVHRDLKPQNVFLTKEGGLKLLDFGTARIFDRAAGSKLSVQGLVMGTPEFMAPEQARGVRAEVDAQSDVWSLGAMIFTVLSGQFVHLGRDAHTRLLVAASKPARKLASVEPTIDERVAVVVDRALEYVKVERWPDVQAMRVAFRHAIVATVPTMRDLKALPDVRDEAEDESEAVPGTLSLSTPALTTASVVTEEAREPSSPPSPEVVPLAVASEPEIETAPDVLPVSRPRAAGIPLVALLVGGAAMAAVLLLVAFFMTGDEGAGRTSAAPPPVALPTPPPPTTTIPIEAPPPAPSFIVITPPDEPPALEVKPEVKPRSHTITSNAPTSVATSPARSAAMSEPATPNVPPDPPAPAPAPAPAPEPSTPASSTNPATGASGTGASANDLSLP